MKPRHKKAGCFHSSQGGGQLRKHVWWGEGPVAVLVYIPSLAVLLAQASLRGAIGGLLDPSNHG